MWEILSGIQLPTQDVVDSILLDKLFWELAEPRSDGTRDISVGNYASAYSLMLLHIPESRTSPRAYFNAILEQLRSAGLIRISPAAIRDGFKTV